MLTLPREIVRMVGGRLLTNPVAACRSTNNGAGCFSATFPTHDIPYSRVRGMRGDRYSKGNS